MDDKNQVNEDKNIGAASVGLKTEQIFTPGPWEVHPSETGAEWDVMTPEGYYVAQAFEMLGVDDREETLANARLIAASPSMAAFLMKIYLDYETDCDCQCDSETCCAVVGEPCAKCHANIALLLIDKPLDPAKRPHPDQSNDGQAS